MLTVDDIKFIVENEGADVSSLLLSKGRNTAGVNLQLCAKCIQAREKMKTKVPLWYSNPSLAYPFSVSVEQGSSQQTAMFKQQIIAGLFNGKAQATADLTGGMGIDSWFISQIAHQHFYFERNSELCCATRYNFGQLGADNITVNNCDITENGCKALEILKGSEISLIYIDPARRDKNNGKTVLLQDYEPDITVLQQKLLGISRYVLVKVSPMADIKLNLKLLPQISTVWVVAVENECKELLFLLDREYSGDHQPVHCINIKGDNIQEFSFTLEQEHTEQCTFAKEPAKYLYEPNKAVLKGGAYKTVATRYQCHKLAASTHLYTSQEKIEGFPGKVFAIEETVVFNKKSLKEVAKQYPKADLSAKNFPLDTNALKKLSGIKDGGEKHIFAVTLSNGEKAMLVCSRIFE